MPSAVDKANVRTKYDAWVISSFVTTERSFESLFAQMTTAPFQSPYR